MSIIRIQKRENPFVQLDRTALEDTRLSWRTKGLHAYLVSRPDDWRISVSHLVKQAKEGRDAVYATLAELITFGYAARIERRQKGKITGYDYIIYEVPLPGNPETAAPPLPDFPDTAEPDTANPTLTICDSNKKDSTDRTEALSKESGRGPRVENSGKVEKRKEPSRESNLSPGARGMLLTRWREFHYAPDGKPPPGYSDGRDVEVLEILVDYNHFGVQEIADAIEGLAMMRKDGQLHGMRTGEKLTARFLQGDRDGRPMVRVAAEYFHAGRKRVAAGPAGFMTAGAALRSALVASEPP